ncbi:hypothetical protein Tco_0369550, partial [Tanacetum coccineum]
LRECSAEFRTFGWAECNSESGRSLCQHCTVKPRKRDAAYLQTQLQIVQKEEAGIQLNFEEFDFMAAAGACEETEKLSYSILFSHG